MAKLEKIGKKLVKRQTKRVEAKPADTISSDNNTERKKIPRKLIITIIGVLILAGLLYYFKGLFLAATVNGEPITRLSLIKELEKEAGKQALNTLVTKILVLQEAKKQNIAITKEDIDAEIKRIEDNFSKQGQNLDQLLSSQGMTREDLTEQIRIQKIAEKLVAKDISVSEKEINDFIESNKASMPEGQKPDEVKNSVEQQLRQQKLNSQIQSLIQELQKKAKISYF